MFVLPFSRVAHLKCCARGLFLSASRWRKADVVFAQTPYQLFSAVLAAMLTNTKFVARVPATMRAGRARFGVRDELDEFQKITVASRYFACDTNFVVRARQKNRPSKYICNIVSGWDPSGADL